MILHDSSEEMFDFVAFFHYSFFHRQHNAIHEHPVARSFTRFYQGTSASLLKEMKGGTGHG
jgi:hypothetical protein